VSARSLTPGADEVAGRIAGAVLAAIRGELGQTQEGLAERLQVGISTIQAWESGRRPLVNASYQDLQRLGRRLRLDGSAPALMHVLDQALLADSIYLDMATAEVRQHPLALVVPDRTLTELLSWPLTGALPRPLHGTKARLHTGDGVRDEIAASLRGAADRSGFDERGAMLRRQVKFLVAGNSMSVDWVREQAIADIRCHTDLRTWSPQWPVTRSQAVASAHAGDLNPLRRFIERGLSDDALVAANLNYWAYWVGEHATPWTDDSDMTRPAGWTGERLLDSLLDGVVNAPYRELCAQALWALLRLRRHLLHRDGIANRLSDVIDRALSGTELDEASRRRLEQVLYLAESAG
jgi:transcriptional regulator with XRE-family HTH domain